MSFQSVPFEKIGSITQGLSVSRYKSREGKLEYIVNVKDLGSLYISQDSDLDQVSFDDKVNIERYRLREGDVVIGIRGTLLNSSVVTKALEGSFPGQNVAVFRAESQQVNPAYIAALMRSEWFKESANVLQKRSSTTLQSIRVSELREFVIPLPAMDVQKQIAQLFSLYESYEKASISALEARKELIEMSFFNLLEQSRVV